VRNELLPEVTIDFLAAGVEGQVTPVQTIKLTNAFLTGIRQYTESTEAGTRSLEDVVFTFQTIETTNYAGKTTASDSLR
jgi:type VI protein secretion system component Hcp